MKMAAFFLSQIRNERLPNGNLAIICHGYHALSHLRARIHSSGSFCRTISSSENRHKGQCSYHPMTRIQSTSAAFRQASLSHARHVPDHLYRTPLTPSHRIDEKSPSTGLRHTYLGCVTHIYVCGGYGSNLHMAVTCACGTSSARPCRELAFGARPACVRVEDFRLGHVLYARVTETFVWGTPCAPQTNIFGKTDPFSPKLAHPVCPKRKSSPFILLKRAPNANYRHPLSRNVPQTQTPAASSSPKYNRYVFPKHARTYM